MKKELTFNQARDRLKVVNKQFDEAKGELSLAQKKMSALQKEQAELTRIINTPSDTIGVSDHALIRYLERKYGFDFQKFREEILTPERVGMIKAGATSISIGSVKMKVTNNIVTTVI